MKKSLKSITTLFLAASLCFGGCSNGESTANSSNDIVLADSEELLESTYPTLEVVALTADGAPEIGAVSAIVVEQSTGTILYEKDAHERLYPASMTKIITALVVLDYYQPEELVKVGTEINEVAWDSSKAGHRVGETLTIRNLIRGLIIPSGNDSANVLAVAVARRAENDALLNFAQSEILFTKLMNDKAKELGAVDTNFTNAHGYHEENHYSCAYDMALFSLAYMEIPILAEIASERSFSGNGADNMFSDDDGLLTQDYAWRSHNLLITNNEYNYSFASGIKTGFTGQAGHCLAASAKKDQDSFITIIFDSEDPGRWLDATGLFEYAFNEYENSILSRQYAALGEIGLVQNNRLEGDTLSVVAAEEVIMYLPVGTAEHVVTTLTYDDAYTIADKEGVISLRAPIEIGAKVGTVSFLVDGEEIMQVDVLASRTINKWTVLSNIKYFFQNFLTIMMSIQGLIGLGIVLLALLLIYIVIRLVRRRGRRARAYGFRSPSKRGGALKQPRKKHRFK